jgi:hypothetical protein
MVSPIPLLKGLIPTIPFVEQHSNTHYTNVLDLEYKSLLSRIEYMFYQMQLYEEQYNTAIKNRVKKVITQQKPTDGSEVKQSSWESSYCANELRKYMEPVKEFNLSEIIPLLQQLCRKTRKTDETLINLNAFELSVAVIHDYWNTLPVEVDAKTLSYLNHVLQNCCASIEASHVWRFGTTENPWRKQSIVEEIYHPTEEEILLKYRELLMEKNVLLKRENQCLKEQIEQQKGGNIDIWNEDLFSVQVKSRMNQDKMDELIKQYPHVLKVSGKDLSNLS